MRRVFVVLAVLAVVLSGAFAMAAVKTYQFTGTVKTVDKDGFSVEKSATETWTFTSDASTKGAPKVGDKVTVTYKMVATSIEVKK
jgi:hypothetical protein